MNTTTKGLLQPRLAQIIGVEGPALPQSVSTARPRTPVEWAIYWARQGLHIFPVELATGEPLVERWYRAASNKKDQVIDWWTQHPKADIGCAIDKSGHYALIAHGETGAGFLYSLEERYTLEPDFRFYTRKENGQDCVMLFKGSAFSTRDTLGAGIHVIGDGRFIFLPPSWSRTIEETLPEDEGENENDE